MGGKERRERTKYSRDLGQYHSRSRRHIRSLSHVAPFLSSPIRTMSYISHSFARSAGGTDDILEDEDRKLALRTAPNGYIQVWTRSEVCTHSQCLEFPFVRRSPNLLHHRETGKIVSARVSSLFSPPASPVNDLQIGF